MSKWVTIYRVCKNKLVYLNKYIFKGFRTPLMVFPLTSVLRISNDIRQITIDTRIDKDSVSVNGKFFKRTFIDYRKRLGSKEGNELLVAIAKRYPYPEYRKIPFAVIREEYYLNFLCSHNYVISKVSDTYDKEGTRSGSLTFRISNVNFNSIERMYVGIKGDRHFSIKKPMSFGRGEGVSTYYTLNIYVNNILTNVKDISTYAYGGSGLGSLWVFEDSDVIYDEKGNPINNYEVDMQRFDMDKVCFFLEKQTYLEVKLEFIYKKTVFTWVDSQNREKPFEHNPVLLDSHKIKNLLFGFSCHDNGGMVEDQKYNPTTCIYCQESM